MCPYNTIYNFPPVPLAPLWRAARRQVSKAKGVNGIMIEALEIVPECATTSATMTRETPALIHMLLL